ncbi:unnamed protein product [Phyllotreta striolata]|uniref:FYVE-type domain-containing protein n=1 Tax=Phyllotreta striolata TaxID=444603 RepID=A0A9N9U0R9_PHYSR|nr:unnamed protein product [Phyllotreta striolata]
MDSLVGNVKSKHMEIGSPILKSIDPNINTYKTNEQKRDYQRHNVQEGLLSLNLDDIEDESRSILLLDDQENLRVHSEDGFLKALNIKPNEKVKVIAIFGNTGEGKSYTLNKLFFDGEECFKTSSSQTSCTLGVWAMYNPKHNVICLDTEGFLGISKRENQRTRLLLKVMAVSDIIIYRTRAERLQRDMYSFLGSASAVYKEHFSSALKKVFVSKEAEAFSGAIGPGVVIFHETRHTETLNESANVTQSAEDILRATFGDLNLSYDAFSFLKYVGVKSARSETCFDTLREALLDKLESTEVRTKRDAKYVYLTLKSLNEKFHNQLSNNTHQLYLPAFFTCTEKCQSCKSNCNLSMGHKDEGEAHQSTQNCTFQYQYQNFVYLCKSCYKNGQRTVVKPKAVPDSSWSSYLNYIWAGYVIECPKCGEIYRSRQSWYGNKNPEESAVYMEVVHIWPGDKTYFQDRSLFGSQNSAQKVLDGVTMITDVISTVGYQPKKMISDWATDKIAPAYWRPNNEIKECFKCKSPFLAHAKKHHCRSCGEGFCEECSSKRQPVPARGWLEDVRVCDNCYTAQPPTLSNAADAAENRSRLIAETVGSTMSAVKSVLDMPVEYIKDFARPTYWTPDGECVHCSVCKNPFGPLRALHHCRECGKGVCDDCSGSRKPVPLRGWPSPVRVCNHCR